MRRLHLITPLLLGLAWAVPVPGAQAQIAVGFSITIAPPILPIYVQPAIPAPGYIWTPGYWAYGPVGYYWVPGTWVLPPTVGLLWTPGYWGWRGGFYGWNAGYWGPHVGFYGGVNYGFGYGGVGYEGGYWNHGVFAYNRNVNNFGGTHITNVYNKTVINNYNSSSRVAFNGGTGGIAAQPTAQQQAFANERHVAPTSLQTQHEQTAASNPALRASVNHGQPAIAATSRPNEFTGRGVVAARPAVTPAATGAPVRPGGASGPAINRPGTVPAAQRPTPTIAHPGAVTPGTQIQHPSTAGTPRPVSPTRPASPARPVTPAAQHPAAAPHPAPSPHPAARPAPKAEERKP
jgi:WXXGXW repeat (2 copies)